MRVGPGVNTISKLRYRTNCPDLKAIAMEYETDTSAYDYGIFEDSRLANASFKLINEAIPTESLFDIAAWSICGNHISVHERSYYPYNLYSFASIRCEGIEDNACE